MTEEHRHFCGAAPCYRMLDEVDQLLLPYKHRERRLLRVGSKQFAGHHVTEWPGLLDQVRANLEVGSGEDDVPGTAVAESRPPTSFPALSVLLRIEVESADWVTRKLHRMGRPRYLLRDTVEGNIRLLVGESAMAGDCNARALCRTVHRWWTWARVESCWDQRAREARDPCPYCGHRALRFRPDGSAAWCSECGSDWDADHVGFLAELLKEGREERDTAAQAAWERARDERRRAEDAGVA